MEGRVEENRGAREGARRENKEEKGNKGGG